MNLTEQIWSLIHYQQHECYVLWLCFITCHSKLVHGFIMLMGIYKWDVMSKHSFVLYSTSAASRAYKCKFSFSTFFVYSFYYESTTSLGPMLGLLYIFNVLVDLLYDYLVPRYVPGTRYCDYTDHFNLYDTVNISNSPLWCIHTKNVRILFVS